MEGARCTLNSIPARVNVKVHSGVYFSLRYCEKVGRSRFYACPGLTEGIVELVVGWSADGRLLKRGRCA